MQLPDIATDAQWAVVALFALAFAGLFITAGISVWRGLRRPVIEDADQAEWLSSVPPWPLARRGPDAITSAGAGGGERVVGLPNSFHGENMPHG